MDILQTSKELLGFVFRRLRNQEGIEKGKITSSMDDELIFKILINAKFKQEKGITLTELENAVKKESGNFIVAYVSQKWDSVRGEINLNSLPYADISNLTTRDIFNKTLRNRIA